MIINVCYLISLILLMLHMGIIDARVYEQNKEIPGWLKSDIIYLGGTLVIILSVTIFAHYFGGSGFIEYTISGILFGSEMWDIAFGLIRYKDAFYPFDKWFYNWGFRNKTQRILFDALRTMISIIILVITL